MSSQASSWTLMEDFFVQECCVQGTDLENHGPTLILCDDPLPIESNNYTHPARFLLSIVEVSKVTVTFRVFLKRAMIRQTSAVIMLMNE